MSLLKHIAMVNKSTEYSTNHFSTFKDKSFIATIYPIASPKGEIYMQAKLIMRHIYWGEDFYTRIALY